MRIVCLANSYREGGRCLGGIELDNNNNPVFKDGRPKWVRPVCNTAHEEVPTYLVSHISPLNIVEFTPIQARGHGHQSENYLFNTNTIRTDGRFPITKLQNLTDNNRFSLVFGNRGAAVPEDKVADLTYSLILLSLNDFETNERVFEDRDYPQLKLSFRFNGTVYNFPVTDPWFQHKYGLNNDILTGRERIYVTLSLAAPHEEWSYKLVAGIIYDNAGHVSAPNQSQLQANSQDWDDLTF